MLIPWIFGFFFFVFIISVLVYVLTIDVTQPPSAGHSRPETVSSSGNGHVAPGGNYTISKAYQVVFSPRAFVDYPFGIRVVFAKPDRSEPVKWKPAERTGSARSNVQRSFRESEYYGWPQSALEDPELMVIGGRLEFESKEAEPTIRVELKCLRESFQALETVEERVLRREEDAVFSFWLNPLTSATGWLALVVSRVAGTVEPTTVGSDGRTGRELTTIELTVPVTSFPVALR